MTDIDDTLTTEGAITPEALQALSDLHDAGLLVVAITGRPVGWSLPFAASWPLHAIVAENGAVALVRQPDGQVLRLYQQDHNVRERNYQRMQAVVEQILQAIPQARIATDSAGRETDVAIDHSEHAHLDASDISRVVSMMRAQGMQATVSSIHINGWFGEHDKWQGACWIARHLWHSDLAHELDRWVYVGDSTNDQRMFAQFKHSVGVANLMRFAPQLTHWPRYLTAQERGAGFAELAQSLLSVR